MIRKYYDGQATNGGGDPQEKGKPVPEILESLWNSGFNQGLSNAIEVLNFYKGVTDEIDAAIDKIIPALEQFKKQTK